MTPDESLPSPSAEAALLHALLHKEGTWVDWGKHCAQLRQWGYDAERIFETTGFQKVQQNLVMVASQVYESLVQEQVDPAVLTYYLGPKSDVLYELRILTQPQRAIAAVEAHRLGLTAEEGKELARALQEWGYLSQLPEGFTAHPGDAMAYQCWKLARPKKDLTARTRLIAKGLKFAHSTTARTALEQLLTQGLTPTKKAPLVPLFRLEDDEQSSRLIPVAGEFPLTAAQVQAVSPLVQHGPFSMAQYAGLLVPVPQWQAILTAQDPIAVITTGSQVSDTLTNLQEPVLVIIDRGQRRWTDQGYFCWTQGEGLTLGWSETKPTGEILGQVIVVLRPQKVFDSQNLREPWQMDD